MRAVLAESLDLKCASAPSLEAGGFARVFGETPLDAGEMSKVLRSCSSSSSGAFPVRGCRPGSPCELSDGQPRRCVMSEVRRAAL